MESAALYFGCWQQKGHYFWRPGMARGPRYRERPTPWEAVDGALTPKTTTAQGTAALHHLDGCTALAVHDYTGDSRPGSNSVFFFDELLDFGAAVVYARSWFPEVVRRIGDIHLASEPPG